MNPLQGTAAKPSKRLKQWLWFLGLWMAGVATIGTLSFLLRAILLP